MLSLLLCLLPSALGVNEIVYNRHDQSSSPGSSLRANNPIMMPFVLASALWSSFAGAQLVNQQPFVDDSDQSIDDEIVTVQLDDDDNDFRGRNIADDFATAPQGFIQFGPLTYYDVFIGVIACFVIGFFAAYDLAGGSLTASRLRLLASRARESGGFLSLGLLIGATWALRGMILLVEVGFVIIGPIFLLQKMYQWTVIENNNRTQTVIAEEGLFIVTQAPVGSGQLTATITAVPTSPTNFFPFMAPTAGAVAIPANSELVVSPSFIQNHNTNYVAIMTTLIIGIVALNFAAAAAFRGGVYALSAAAAIISLAGFVLVVIFASIEVSDVNPGQQWGEEIAALVYGAVATLILLVLVVFFVGLAVFLASEEYNNILGLNDEEIETQLANSGKKRT